MPCAMGIEVVLGVAEYAALASRVVWHSSASSGPSMRLHLTPCRMTKVNRFRQFALSAAITCLAALSHARCVLPIPDGGAEAPSRANVEGVIASIQHDVVTIQPNNATQPVRVRVKSPIYTAFGGDGDLSDLQVGQLTWVWFPGCRRNAQRLPEAAYFQIYSKDPKDRP